MTPFHVQHDWFIRVIWVVHTCDMNLSYVWLDSFMCVTGRIRMCDMRIHMWHDSFICATGLIHMCDLTHSCVQQDEFTCAAWLIHMFDMTRSYVRQDSFICVTWLTHMCDMTRSYVWHDSFICETWLVYMCDRSHSYAWFHSFTYATWIKGRKGAKFEWRVHMYIEPYTNTHTHTHTQLDISRILLSHSHSYVWHPSLKRIFYSTRARTHINTCTHVHAYSAVANGAKMRALIFLIQFALYGYWECVGW